MSRYEKELVIAILYQRFLIETIKSCLIGGLYAKEEVLVVNKSICRLSMSLRWKMCYYQQMWEKKKRSRRPKKRWYVCSRLHCL